MSRYTGSRLRIIRRLGKLPGFSTKTITRKERPGQRGTSFKKPSQYGIRLQEKQKIRYNYGITERQLIKYVRQARKLKGSTGENLLHLLEMRLDNILFRFGFAPTIIAARQLVTHGHFLVNNKKVTIPSYLCVPKENISVAKKQKTLNLIKKFLLQSHENKVPPHLIFNKENLSGTINSNINRRFIGLQKLNELLIVEFYSRKV